MEDPLSFPPRDEHTLYLGDPVGPYLMVVVGAPVMRSPLPDEVGYKEKEEDTTHDCGRSYLRGSPVTVSTMIRVITSLKEVQI